MVLGLAFGAGDGGGGGARGGGACERHFWGCWG